VSIETLLSRTECVRGRSHGMQCGHAHGYARSVNGPLTKIMVLKTSQFKTVGKDNSGYITQLKQQKSKR